MIWGKKTKPKTCFVCDKPYTQTTKDGTEFEVTPVTLKYSYDGGSSEVSICHECAYHIEEGNKTHD
jgi:hypothetical protein